MSGSVINAVQPGILKEEAQLARYLKLSITAHRCLFLVPTGESRGAGFECAELITYSYKSSLNSIS